LIFFSNLSKGKKNFIDFEYRKKYQYVFVRSIGKKMIRFHSKMKLKELTSYQSFMSETCNKAHDESSEEHTESEKADDLKVIDEKTFESIGFVFDYCMNHYFDPENGLYYDHVLSKITKYN
jgi:hypothetical protein